MSGWSYGEWKGLFYPEELKSKEWLSFYAQYFDTTEINSSFYHLPRPATVAGWMAQVPDTFKFCPKLSRYITHIKRLHEAEDGLQRYFKSFEQARHMLGPVLIQLPPSLAFDPVRIKAFFDILKSDYKHYEFALEARHKSWLDDEAIKLCKRYHISWVIAQSGVGYPYLEKVTSDHVYVRFHGPGRLYASSYSDEMLQEYAIKFRKWASAGHHVWAFFNNTMNGVALDNGRRLIELLSA